MYRIDRIHVKNASPAGQYADRMAHLAKNLKNAAVFRLRNHFTARNKDPKDLTPNEQEVEHELALI